MALEPLKPVSMRVKMVMYAAIVIMIALGVIKARPPSHVVIEVGPVGGSFYQTAMQYRRLLAERGIELEIRPKANSLEILPDLANPDAAVDVGFEAQDASSYNNGRIYTIGTIQLQPLFVFANSDLGRRIPLTDLRGHRIVMPPAESATSDSALRVFRLYDITPDNTSFTFMAIADAAKELRAGHFDAGVFMLAPENDLVRSLARWSGVRLVPIGEAKAIANHLPFLRAVVLPRGIYDLADGIPQSDTQMLAGTVDVVVRQGLHPYVIYSLLAAMNTVHRAPTLISSAGTYPTIAGTDLAVHSSVEDYYRSGPPWAYRRLPPLLASFIDRYLVYLTALFAFAEIYRLSHYFAEFASALVRWRRRAQVATRQSGAPRGYADGS